ncbi:hypothetical protein B0T26DRAFT_711411 [Lasiosphaeria miniovina]|uniref:Uncharacterized protein n=1 Tax=Lasiosphaeria miniovina TaxID=1954250 RepID=A0AA40ALA5_9PEZI|nr:uncharacterized protein B0T26DRAFT_711411 [Lasiosphaeria miniovina]KAK0717943.1 hypothetical protein B0T26DRAFT_711411 [Lasiosphaeria miniovina]
MGVAVGRRRPTMTTSLPNLHQVSELELVSALDNLIAIYCPAAAAASYSSALYKTSHRPFQLEAESSPLTDSGYNSGYASEDDDEGQESPSAALDEDLRVIRADDMKRRCTIRWLERFIASADGNDDDGPRCIFALDDVRHLAVEKAAALLVALLNPVGRDEEDQEAEDAEDGGFCREFSFVCGDKDSISVRLNDGLAGTKDDHLDVGLQTWGASILFCQMMCGAPSQFGLATESCGLSPRIVELGAGTGLVSLVLAQLLPRLGFDQPAVVATDYRPSVLRNLHDNIAANSSSKISIPIVAQTCALDWAQTELDPAWPLKGDGLADVLLATDVIYDKTHTALLHGCASRLLAADGIFWLLQTVRQNGHLCEVTETVEQVFGKGSPSESGSSASRSLTVLELKKIERRNGVGRGDESFYRLFKIGWA